MNNPTLDDAIVVAFDHVDIDDTMAELAGDSAFCAAVKARHDLPAWKRIEEYREMRELNRHLMDDVYGSKPVQTLWDGD